MEVMNTAVGLEDEDLAEMADELMQDGLSSWEEGESEEIIDACIDEES